ncbi:MAG: polysaccharide pyruvyl transferase family protein [bacterium JZ-2024 1]
MNIFLVGYFGAGNLGDELALNLFLEGIRPFDTRIFALTRGKYPLPHGLIPVYYRDVFSVYHALHRADTVIFLSGDLLCDIFRRKSTLYYLTLATATGKMKKGLYFLSQTLSPVQNTLIFWMLKRIAPETTAITFRDAPSFHYAQQFLFPKILLTADWTFLLPVSQENPAKRIEETIVIPRKNSPFSERDWEAIVQKIPNPVCFMAFHRMDEPLCFRLSGKLPLARVIPYSPDVEGILEKLREAKEIYSARLHGLILGVLVGTPVAGINLLPKIGYFCEEMNLPFFPMIPKEGQKSLEMNIPKVAGSDKIEIMRKRAEENWKVLPLQRKKSE